MFRSKKIFALRQKSAGTFNQLRCFYLILSLFYSFPGRFGRVIVTTKDGDRNLIRREVFEELRILDGMIQNATISYDDQTFTYKDVCAKWLGDCFENDILNLDQIMDEVSLPH